MKERILSTIFIVLAPEVMEEMTTTIPNPPDPSKHGTGETGNPTGDKYLRSDFPSIGPDMFDKRSRAGATVDQFQMRKHLVNLKKRLRFQLEAGTTTGQLRIPAQLEGERNVASHEVHHTGDDGIVDR